MSILKALTNHLVEFADEIKKVFPGDPDLRTGIIFLKGLIKINPKTIIQGWKECVNDPYKEKILAGDVGYFINKDYSSDLQGSNNQGRVLMVIESFRGKVKNMGDDNKNKSIKYLQNLTKLCSMYYKNN